MTTTTMLSMALRSLTTTWSRSAIGASRLCYRSRGTSTRSSTHLPDVANDGRLTEDQVAFASDEVIRDPMVTEVSQGEEAKDNGDKTFLIFPGQGAQYVGMGAKLIDDVDAVKDIFERASHILGYDLAKICREGPKELLDRTEYSQPAVVVSSLAAVEKLYRDDPKAVEQCFATAGFSVGEITALIFSGALSFDDGIQLVKTRAQAMQFCSDLTPSGMATVFFGRNHKLGAACIAAKQWVQRQALLQPEEIPVCNVANYLYSGAKVVAGHDACLRFLEEHGPSDFGLKKIRRLPVSGAFHTQLMRPAVPVLKECLRNLDVQAPRIVVHSNHEGRVLRTDDHVRATLPKQMVSPVKWEQLMSEMFRDYEHASLMPTAIECGPGKGLRAILGQVNGKAARRSRFVTA